MPLCIICHKKTPPEGKTVCGFCEKKQAYDDACKKSSQTDTNCQRPCTPTKLKVIVTDRTGTWKIRNATVEITDIKNKKQEKLTDKDGLAEWQDIAPSGYDIKVSKTDYAPATDKEKYHVSVPLGTTQRVEAKLKPVNPVITVIYDDDQSNIMEVWDLWINDGPVESKAVFRITTNPADYGPVKYTAWVENGSGTTVRRNLAVDAQEEPARLCTVSWDGKQDDGNKVAMTDGYKIRLKGEADGTESEPASSRKMKIVRVGVKSLNFTHTIPIKFAFKGYNSGNYTLANDDIDVQWNIDSLDAGGVPQKAPSCNTSGKNSNPSYCYPLAAKINEQLTFDATTAGDNYGSGDKIRLRIVDVITGKDWNETPQADIGNNTTLSFRAKSEFKLGDHVSLEHIGFNFIYEYENSKKHMITLGRQDCSQFVIFVIVSDPTEPWGLGHERPWVELLEKICTDWAMGAKNQDEAAGKIVEAVNTKMTLTYHTNGAYDWDLVIKVHSSFKPVSIALRDFLKYLTGASSRPVTWNHINCTCCGALVSTMANCIGCSLQSSIMAHNTSSIIPTWTDLGNGFSCVKIKSIGSSMWKHPFPNASDTEGGFLYHEVAWTGNAGDTDKIYDACLKVAQDPAQPAINDIFVKGIIFGVDPGNYKSKLIDTSMTPITDVVALSALAGRYKPT